MLLIKDIKESLLHLLFPHVCEGCGSDLVSTHNLLCLHCISSLPQTFFELHPDNPIEKIFLGRIPISSATAQYYFTKESLMQHLVGQFKYRGNKELGLYLGNLMGTSLVQSSRFMDVDALIPLPLFTAKEHKRGFNQAAILCDGMAAIMKIPVLKDVLIRTKHTDSQTTKNRVERWQNIEGKFRLVNEKAVEGKRVLLVDDVVTTGATLEAGSRALLQAEEVQVSIATLCFSSS